MNQHVKELKELVTLRLGACAYKTRAYKRATSKLKTIAWESETWSWAREPATQNMKFAPSWFAHSSAEK